MLVSERQLVSLHTHSGVTLYEFDPDNFTSLLWSRQLRDVSRCELVVPSELDYNRLPDLVPWTHWCSVWDEHAENLYWTGPIQTTSTNRRQLTVSSRDMSAYFARTRNPITKRWDAADPSKIAGELVDSMIEGKGLDVKSIKRADPQGNPFDYSVVADAQMLDATISDLVQMGLKWTVVSGIPILGPMPVGAVTELTEADFLGDGPTIGRDGSQTFNDILVRGATDIVNKRVPFADQQLEAIVNVDSIFGPSNAARAADQYAKYVSTVRDNVTLPSGSVLHPDAPATIDELIPSARFTIDAYGLQTLQELESLECRIEGGESSVSVNMESVVELPELFDLKKYKATG